MKLTSFNCLFFLVILFSFPVQAQKIERFEHLNTADGLSQNSVLSMLCDSKGYMWFGTMNGLNRYDGHVFQVYKVQKGKKNVLTHNRIIKIWEDARKVLWVKTYDGYIHYFIPETEEFITFPHYLNSFEEKNSLISFFEQTSEDEIWLGSTNSGAYHLKYDPATKRYLVRSFTQRGKSRISHNAVTFVVADPGKDIWIGTEKGLSKLPYSEFQSPSPTFEHLFPPENFSCATRMGQYAYFGTALKGLKVYNTASATFEAIPEALKRLENSSISLLQSTSDHKLLIGTRQKGLLLYDPKGKSADHYLDGHSISRVYEDYEGKLWINTSEFGIYKVNPQNRQLKNYQLTTHDASLLDDERQFLYEDSSHRLWIGLHGSLALYNREEDKFEFYKNDPKDPSSISSNIVYCLTEDKSGLLWLGTGQPNGGVDKIITANPSFQQLVPNKNLRDYSENVVRALFHDSNHYVWASTKSGQLYLAPPSDALPAREEPAFKPALNLAHNIYSIMEDKEGYIWMGSKGGGVYVSKESVKDNKDFYRHMEFHRYTHHPTEATSLSNDNVYSIHQDHKKRIWIGTYGGGLNLVLQRSNNQLRTLHFNTYNSSLSSNEIRHVYEDSQNRLWVLTTFGLNVLPAEDRKDYKFQSFLYDPEDLNSLSYNDVVHVLEDSQKNLWFTTFGGGVNRLIKYQKDGAVFERYNQQNGLLNDAVFCALEDSNGFIWFSTEKGLSRLDPQKGLFENFDRNSGLPIESFNENTGTLSPNGHLMFGNSGGALLISPEKLNKSSFEPPLVITNFQIFNKDVDYTEPGAPIQQHIETLDKIELNHYQSSFSIEYAALSYFASSKNKYAFKLDNFDDRWNEVGNQRKATYTNLLPGNYTFRVKAASWDGSWNEYPRTLEIVILAPWWATWYAKLLYLLLGLFIVEAIRRSYVRYNRLQNDLTVEKRINEIKLRFFTNISHEIRTPLTLILGPLEDIKALPHLPAEASSRLMIMEKNGKRMLRLVNQLLDFRKIQKNKMKLSVREVELNSFLQDVIINFNPLAEHKKITLSYHTNQPKLPVWIDGKMFDSVVFNILSNAFKFTPEGKSIKVGVENNEQFIDISIQDEGPGIPKEKSHLLFQRYSALSAPDGKMNSTGIGLSLAYEIMKLHQGDILVESEEGNGSRFTIRLLNGFEHLLKANIALSGNGDNDTEYHEEVLPETNTFSSTPDASLEEEKAKEQYKVLIVEDNPDIVHYLTEILAPHYLIRTAPNGKKGLALLADYLPDLLITDVMMPEMDGIEMTRKIKNTMETSHIPVIMLTAKSAVGDQVMGIESGAEAYLLKPFNSQLLKATIKNIIKQRRTILDKFLKKDLPESHPVKKEIVIDEITITPKDEQFLDKLMKYVEENYDDPDFNVEKLADSANVSRTVFYNKIKGLTGLSPSEFLRQIRLKIAGKMLLNSDLNVSEVAYRTGFNNVKYFRSHFKNLYGINPSEFKSKNNAVEDPESSPTA